MLIIINAMTVMPQFIIFFLYGFAACLFSCVGTTGSGKPGVAHKQIKSQKYDLALDSFRIALQVFSLDNESPKAVFYFQNAESFLEEFWDENPDLKIIFGGNGLSFFRDELSEKEKIVFDGYIAHSQKLFGHYDQQADTAEQYDITEPSGHPREDLEDITLGALKLQQVIENRIAVFETLYPAAHVGVSLIDLDDGDSGSRVAGYNEDQCFIPASLTKIILEGAFIDALKQHSESEAIDETLIRLVHELNMDDDVYSSVFDLFQRLNVYSFSTAYLANQAALFLGDFLVALSDDGSDLDEICKSFIAHYSIPDSCTRIIHPAGLSLYNLLTPAQVGDALFYLKNEPGFTDSLLLPGQGTLEHRLLPLSSEEHIFKTGSLRENGVLCLAGYLFDQQFSLVVMINGLDQDNFDEVLAWLDEMTLELCDI